MIDDVNYNFVVFKKNAKFQGLYQWRIKNFKIFK